VNVDIVLGLLSTAASLAGLAWNRDGFRRLALALLTLFGLILLLIGVVQRRAIQRVEDQIVNTMGTSAMSADQLYEDVYTTQISRPMFDAALNHAVETRRLVHKMVDIRTPDNLEFRVRVYSVP
jgi:hypothetical protein